MSNIALNFVGPFDLGFGANSVFESAVAGAAGIYLWTITQRTNGAQLIHYVGEAESFARRQREHLINVFGLNYGIWAADKAQDGISELIWPGLWRLKTASGPPRLIEAYERIHEHVIPYVSIIRIYFAEVSVDRSLRRHIEGCIGWNLRTKYPEWKTLYPDDNYIGAQAIKDRGELLISAPAVIRGLDTRIPY